MCSQFRVTDTELRDMQSKSMDKYQAEEASSMEMKPKSFHLPEQTNMAAAYALANQGHVDVSKLAEKFKMLTEPQHSTSVGEIKFSIRLFLPHVFIQQWNLDVTAFAWRPCWSIQIDDNSISVNSLKGSAGTSLQSSTVKADYPVWLGKN